MKTVAGAMLLAASMTVVAAPATSVTAAPAPATYLSDDPAPPPPPPGEESPPPSAVAVGDVEVAVGGVDRDYVAVQAGYGAITDTVPPTSLVT
jgi:hypothetical protein